MFKISYLKVEIRRCDGWATKMCRFPGATNSKLAFHSIVAEEISRAEKTVVNNRG
jgi:hypothetical protein